MAKFRFIALIGVAILAVGCRFSDHSLHVKDQLITVGALHQLPPNTIPFAISRDGSRIAIWDGLQEIESLDHSDEKITLRVVDSETFAPIGKSLPLEDPRGIAFDPTGTRLHIAQEDKYVAWNYTEGTFEPVSDTVPNILPIDPWDCFANLDHSILYLRPGASSFYHQPDPKATEGSDGCVLAGSRSYAIPFTRTLGFDPYGDFWYKVGGKWTKVSRDGERTVAGAGPKFLTKDQTKSSGTLHLALTFTDMKYKDATAKVESVWLTDDRPTRDPVNPQTHYQAALVFSGADIFDFGFVPHQQKVYVVTATGSYIIPYRFESDAVRAKKLKEMRERAGNPKVPTLRYPGGQ